MAPHDEKGDLHEGIDAVVLKDQGEAREGSRLVRLKGDNGW
jgi:hypothetical protein